MVQRFIVISGCSGGGKSTLLTELAASGHAVVTEPGRRIVEQELARGGSALPWRDLDAFLQRAVAMAIEDRAAAQALLGLVFFDRGLVDALVGLQHLRGDAVLDPLAQNARYHRQVFLTPPWPEIYVTDHERRHDMEAALAEYERLVAAYPALGYDVTVLPKTSVEERAELILAAVAGGED